MTARSGRSTGWWGWNIGLGICEGREPCERFGRRSGSGRDSVRGTHNGCVLVTGRWREHHPFPESIDSVVLHEFYSLSSCCSGADSPFKEPANRGRARSPEPLLIHQKCAEPAVDIGIANDGIACSGGEHRCDQEWPNWLGAWLWSLLARRAASHAENALRSRLDIEGHYRHGCLEACRGPKNRP